MGGKRILEQAIEFEGIVNNIFKEAGYETNTFDYYRDHLYDIEAKKGEETYCIEIKFMNNKNRAPLSLYKKAITKLINATDKKSGIPVFVVSGLLERKEKEFLKQREDVQILDISNLLYSVEDNDKLTNQLISFLPYSVMDIVSQKCFVKIDSLQHGGYAKSLIKELELINAGRDDFNKYEDVCMKILQYIFEDDLTLWLSQAKSNEDLYRFDCLCRIKNNNEKEFWTILERYFNTKYIVFEFKNYSEKISQREIYTTERYLYAKALRKLNLLTRTLSINRSHPYVANYMDSNSNIIPLESMVITEVLTESHLYELSLDESMVNEIIKRRDSTLRQLALSDKMGIPTAAMFLKDSLDNPSGLEEAVARVLTVFGFEVTPIGGNGEPDGKAEACLGFSEEGKNKSYSLTYDAKSTAKNKIAAATAHLSGLRRHREAYNADFSLEVAVDYQGAEDELSAISVEAKNEKVTMMTAKDLIKLLLLITPKQIGLDKLRELFETCYMPQDVHEWIENIEKTEVEKPPYYELVDVVYELQKTDSEAPELGTIRYKLKEKMNKNYSKMQVREWLVLLSNLIPGCVTIDGNYVGVQASAQIIKERIHKAINDMPLGYKPLYDEIFK